MSADLLAAFGCSTSEESRKNSTGGRRVIDGMTDQLVPGLEPHDQLTSGARQTNIAGEDVNAEFDFGRQGAALWLQDPHGQDLLFNASEEQPKEADDDFGEFEDVEAPGSEPRKSLDDDPTVEHESASMRANSVAATPVDLLGLHEKHHEGLDDSWDDFSGSTTGGTTVKTLLRTIERSRADLPEPMVLSQEEDDWQPFEDGQETIFIGPTVNEAQPSAGTITEAPMPAARIASPPKTASILSMGDVRPMNIPPPAVLLQMLPQVFCQLRAEAHKLGDLTGSHGTDSAAVGLAKDISQTFAVAARITAGRGLRWKRDSILAQSMKIGPAAAGGGGRGMKLTAVDKSESLREEKEVADLVSEWQKNAHLFNSTVKQAGIHHPLMNLYMSVKPRAGESSVLRAPHACALCGIKRDERLPQVDVDVEDSFGEYWTEHWGHRDCREFWLKYEKLLSRR